MSTGDPMSINAWNNQPNIPSFNYRCPQCGGCYNQPMKDNGYTYNSNGNPRCPFCGNKHKGD